jgi:AMP-binding enzyme
MILGDSAPATGQTPESQSRITIDDLFRRAAARRPDAIALADAPNRDGFTDGPPRRLSYAEADRMVSAIAGRFHRMGLPTDAIVGVQLPNTVENVLTILGILRAGLIAAPLPLLWRRADTVAALTRVGAKVLITCRRVGEFEHSQFATRVAADVFSIRYVCGFGAPVPDGVVPFDDLFAAAKPDPIPVLERAGNAAAHLALISFEVGADGPVPVARRHLELFAGGLGVLLESRLEQDGTVLSSIAPSTFAGVCLTLVPWLFCGGTLVLHHPFDAEVFACQRRDERCGTLIVPAPVAFRLAATGLFAREGPTTILAPWYAPDQLAESTDWREPDTNLVDVALFGEAGLIAARRGADGRPAPIPLGPILAPHDSQNGMPIVELSATTTGTLALRGPMVPRHVFPPGIEHSDQSHFELGRDGTVDTGYPCLVDAGAKTVTVTGPPAGIVSVGGYRFPLRKLQETIGRIDGDASLVASPDALLGQRLTGTAPDLQAMQVALNGIGLNPLIALAFAERAERTSAPQLSMVGNQQSKAV